MSIIPKYCDVSKVIEKTKLFQDEYFKYANEANAEGISREAALETFVLTKLAVLDYEIGIAIRTTMEH